MNGQTIKQRYVRYLLDRVKEDRFPSLAQMDMIEATVSDPEQFVEYMEALIEKLEETRFPSLQLLGRIQRLAAALPE